MRHALERLPAAIPKGLSRGLAVWVAFLSLCLFFLMGADKRKAKKKRWRVPEKTLFLLALLGGAPGGWAGMAVFRHKTKHLSFKLLFPLLTILWLAALLVTAFAAG